MYNIIPSAKLLDTIKAVTTVLDNKEAKFATKKCEADGSLQDDLARAQMQQENGLEQACTLIATFGCGLGTRVPNLKYYDGCRTQPQNCCC